MKVKVIGIESRIGQSKATGNDYAIHQMRYITELPQGKVTQHNPNNVHVRSGYVFGEENISPELHTQLELVGKFPFDADLEMTQQIGRNNKMDNVVTDVKPTSSATAKLMTGS